MNTNVSTNPTNETAEETELRVPRRNTMVEALDDFKWLAGLRSASGVSPDVLATLVLAADVRTLRRVLDSKLDRIAAGRLPELVSVLRGIEALIAARSVSDLRSGELRNRGGSL